jgi:hypothetical protein
MQDNGVMRSYKPGGRFDADFETDDILKGIDADLKNPVGTHALWYIWDDTNSHVDPIYDVGADPALGVGYGRTWRGPYKLPVIRAIWSQGDVKTSEIGYYNDDTLHLTLNAQDIETIAPGFFKIPEIQLRGRLIWKNQVYRPYGIQQRGIVAERYTIVTVECIQVMPEEMINDPQFQAYAN